MSQGLQYFPEKLPRHVKVLFGQAILMVAGADGSLALEEGEYFYREAKINGVEEDIIREWREFDWSKSDLQSTVETLKPALTDKLKSLLVYCAIRISLADSSYPLTEQDAVRKAAELLDIDDKAVVELEILASMDKNVADLKQLNFAS